MRSGTEVNFLPTIARRDALETLTEYTKDH